MRKQRIINIITVMMVCIMMVGLLAPIAASAAAKDDYAAAQQKLDAINKEISSLKNEKTKKQKELSYAQSQAKLLKEQISILNTDIANTGAELLAKQQELEAKKESIKETDELFKQRLKAMYMMRSSGTLATILGVEDFSQFMTATDTLQRISVNDTELLAQLEAEKKIIMEQEAEIQGQLTTLEEKQETLNSKQSQLATTMTKLNNSLTTIEAEQRIAEETQKDIYADYLAAKQAMEKEFASGGGNYVGGEWLWPVPSNGYVSSGFGWRTLYGRPDNHIGIDIATGWGQGWPAINRQPIVASNSGRVIKAMYGNTGYGNYVIIDHGGSNFTLYGHCASLSVKVGDYVNQGQKIATVGSTGNSTGPHLHFEIRLNGSPVNPLPLVKGSQPRR